jgi:hypothetical protein
VDYGRVSGRAAEAGGNDVISTVNGNDALLALIKIFDDLEISYMVVGSYSSNLYGVPRATKDADLVFHFETSDLAEVAKRLPEGIFFDEQSSFEMVTATRREILLLEGSDFKIELFHLSQDGFDQERFENRVRVQLDQETKVWAPRAEDVVIQKLRWAKGGSRSKDFDDVVNILKVQKKLNFDHIKHWCTEHVTSDLLELARAEAS